VSLLGLASLYVQVLGASYGWFHTKHVCRAFDPVKKRLGGGLESIPCDGHAFLSSDLMIHHYLFWNGRVVNRSSGVWPELPWVPRERSPTVASLTFRGRRFNERWLTKDYLFWNLSMFFQTQRPPATATGLKYALIALALGSAVVGVRAIRREERDLAR
jgi:hypothetical protein